jgi:hypothetical protein
MAAADMTGNRYSVVEATTTSAALTLEEDYEYTLTHLGVNPEGTADTDTIFLSETDPAVATYAIATDKLVLKDGMVQVVGPGVATMYFITPNNDGPVFSVNRAPERLDTGRD